MERELTLKFPNNKCYKRISGLLYAKEGDFIVQEINSNGWFSELNKKKLNFPSETKKEFVSVFLVKKGISTFQAVSELSDFLGIKKEAICYHGLKDTFGITSQEISLPTGVFLRKYNKLKEKYFENFFIKDAKFIDEPCKLRDIKGNRFVITLREPEKDGFKKINQIPLEHIPNFYGYQRFGTRQNSHLIGRQLVKKHYSKALKICCTYSRNESPKIKKARMEILSNWGNWGRCINITKKVSELKNENKIFKQLIKDPQDCIKALNETGLTSFYVNSYSSFLFNIVLDRLIEKRKKISLLPVLGYTISLKNSAIKKEYARLMDKEKISLSDFFNEDHPELSFPGRYRAAFYTVEKLDYEKKRRDVLFSFVLPMGVYANLFLERFIENKSGRFKLE